MMAGPTRPPFPVYPPDAVFEWRGPDGIAHRDAARHVPANDAGVEVLGQCAVFTLEDDKQINQLCEFLYDNTAVMTNHKREHVRNALSRFLMPAVPPPIEEPVTLGAIVETDDGEGHVLIQTKVGPRWRRITTRHIFVWEQMRVVKVHSDGFTPTTGADA